METAIRSVSSEKDSVSFDVRWRPFQLSQDLPYGKGVDKMTYYNRKFGSERVRSIIPHMKNVAKEEGIEMSYGGNIGNTFDSHRLIWKAHVDGGSELQDKVVEELFKAYFEQEQSLGDHEVLKTCAEKAGMDASFLLNDPSVGQEETLAEMEEFRTKYRCSGVPFFVFDKKHALSGAQPPEEIISVFEKLLK